jgi:enoyl-CoA hydratase/carnithine racemase
MEPDYFKRFDHLMMSRTDDGILEVRFATNGGPIVFTGKDHHDFVEAFSHIAQDRDNKIVIITGTGDEWMAQIDGPSLGDFSNPFEFNRTWWEGQSVLQNLCSIGCPVIAAINGAASVHTEYALTADIIIASENAYFQDYPHLTFGVVPGDGIYTAWTMAIGDRRARHFLLTMEKIDAQKAKDLGIVAQVLPDGAALMARAYDVARKLLKIPELTRRFMRSMFTLELRSKLLNHVGYGLAMEGSSAAALKVAAQEKKPVKA